MTPDAEAKMLVSGALSPVGKANFSGIDATILLGGDMAPFTVMDMTVAPGMGAPAHISFHEEKVFHVAEGSFLFLVDEERVTVERGSMSMLPRASRTASPPLAKTRLG